MLDEEVTYKVRGAIFTVFRELGPGLFESVYERALAVELALAGLFVQRQMGVPVTYKGRNLDIGFKVDLLVNDRVIIEVKSVAELHDVHKEAVTYLSQTYRQARRSPRQFQLSHPQG
jgi:GxxExxY protein